MKAKIYQTKTGFEVVNGAGALFLLTPSDGGFNVKQCGIVGDTWTGSGTLLKRIPNNVKTKFFELQKTTGK